MSTSEGEWEELLWLIEEAHDAWDDNERDGGPDVEDVLARVCANPVFRVLCTLCGRTKGCQT